MVKIKLIESVNVNSVIMSSVIITIMSVYLYYYEKCAFLGMYGVIALADCLTIVSLMKVYCVTIPLFCLWIVILARYDFRFDVIVRMGDRSKIWKKQCIRIIVTAMSVSTVLILEAMIFQIAHVSCVINWDSTSSAFYYYSNSIILYRFTFDGSIVECILFTWLSMVIIFSSAAVVVMILFWVFTNYICGISVIVMSVFIDTWTSFNLFWKYISLDVADYKSFNDIFARLLISTVVLAAAVSIGNVVAKNKDFIKV